VRDRFITRQGDSAVTKSYRTYLHATPSYLAPHAIDNFWRTVLLRRQFLDMRVESVLNPRSFGSFWRFLTAARLHPQWLWERPCLFIVTVETTELRLPSNIEAVAEAAATVAGIIKRLEISEEIVFGIDMAVREAVTNAIVHGNRLDETKFVKLTLKTSPDMLEILVHDQGVGFNPNDVPDPTRDENILKTSGRGIFFMRNFMDTVDWSLHPAGGTTVRMTKQL